MLQLIRGSHVCRIMIVLVGQYVLTVLNRHQKYCQDGDFISDLKPKRISGPSLCFRAFLNAGWGLYIHLKATGGTVTKTGWFWARRFNCDSKPICANTCDETIIWFCVCVLCCRLLE